jgi:hypothetical protein
VSVMGWGFNERAAECSLSSEATGKQRMEKVILFIP